MLFIAGPAVDRYGSRAVAVSGAVFAAATTLPGLAGSLPLLALALLVAGGASGALDVGINANAGRLEAESGRRIMPMAHGLYSVGILVGAVGAGLARSAGAHRETILLAVAVLIALTAALLGTERIEPAPSEGTHTIRHRARAARARDPLRGRVRRRGRHRELERALPRARARRVARRQRARAGRLRRVDGGRALLRPGHAARRADAARRQRAARGRRLLPGGASRRARRSRSSGSHSAARASRCTRRSSSAPAAGAARARSRR